jgi:hypothetical protein
LRRHVALLTPEFLLQLGLDPRAKVLDLRGLGALLIEWQSSPQSRGASAQGEVNLQTIHHSPKEKSKITIKGVSVKSQRWVARPPGDRVRAV